MAGFRQRHGLTWRRIDFVLVLGFVMLAVSPLAQAGLDGRSTRALLAVSTGCSSGSGAVAIFDFGYMPSLCEVSTGASVTWTNTGQKTHTVTRCDDRCPVGPGSAPASSAFDTTLPPDVRGSVTFSSPGTYVYFCTIHGYDTMHGEVDVAQATPTTTPPSPHPTQATNRPPDAQTQPTVTTSGPVTPSRSAPPAPSTSAPSTSAPSTLPPPVSQPTTVRGEAQRVSRHGGGSSAALLVAVVLGALALGGGGFLLYRRRAG